MCTLPTKRMTKQMPPPASPGGENLLEGLTFFCPKLADQGFIWEAAKKKILEWFLTSSWYVDEELTLF